VALRLEPLDEREAEELIRDLPAALRGRISDVAGGNPLFLTEMRAMAQNDVEIDVPPTLRALLAARIDQLEEAERRVLERGSVEGELFHRGAVQALAPDDAEVTPGLAALVRRELIRPDRAQLAGDEGFRFRHILIRDAAYEALPKAVRAELHERFAVWLDERGTGLVEIDELLGYHFEQAARYREELGQPDPTLAGRAADRLASAGRRALWRGDERSAAALLDRALVLRRPFHSDVHLELDLAGAQGTSDESAAIAEAAAVRAMDAGDATGESLARLIAASYRWNFAEAESLAQTVVPALERAGDHAGLVRVWFALAYGVANANGRYEEQARAAEEAIRHADLAGQPRGRLFSLAMALVLGPRPADEALRALDSVLPDVPHPGSRVTRAWLLAMLGRFDEAWAIALEAAERRREFAAGVGSDHILAEIAALEGDHRRASRYLRDFCAQLEALGEHHTLSTYAGRLALSLCAEGAYEEAERWSARGSELPDVSDITQTWWRQARALILAHRGRHGEAARLAREAVAIAEQTDSPSAQGDGHRTLAEVLAAAGRRDDAIAELEHALERYGRKNNVAMVAQVRPRLEQLRKATAA
jgi:tetratricopeptide (TPR) repeat protein